MRRAQALIVLGAALLAGALLRPVQAVSGGVQIIDFGYAPQSVAVTVGTTVVWTNVGAVPHTVTSAAGGFDSGLLNTGQSYVQTFSRPATFSYLCTLHPWMTGQVVVEAAAPAPAAAPVAPSTSTRLSSGGAPNAGTQPASSGVSSAAAGVSVGPPVRAMPVVGMGSASGKAEAAVPALLGAVVLAWLGLVLLRAQRRCR